MTLNLWFSPTLWVCWIVHVCHHTWFMWHWPLIPGPLHARLSLHQLSCIHSSRIIFKDHAIIYINDVQANNGLVLHTLKMNSFERYIARLFTNISSHEYSFHNNNNTILYKKFQVCGFLKHKKQGRTRAQWEIKWNSNSNGVNNSASNFLN